MSGVVLNFLRTFRRFNQSEQHALGELQAYGIQDEISDIRRLLKKRKVSISFKSIKTSRAIGIELDYPQITDKTNDPQLQKLARRISLDVEDTAHLRAYKRFSKDAFEKIVVSIGANIFGYPEIKQAVALQLFAPEAFHILLLGDPGTGKTQILHSATELSPISSFGLGSGTTGAGLAVTKRGKKVEKGLLPQADQGLCAIDELNLMKQSDYGSMYNAMEKGFVTYDKGGDHLRFDARVKVLAAANPKGDRFVGNVIRVLKDQLPFESALLGRFHLVFLMRRPGVEDFKSISKKIARGQKKQTPKEDLAFIKGYVEFAERIEPEFSKDFEEIVSDYSEELKRNEEKYLVDMSPRIIVGLIRLAKARARIKLKRLVERQDLELAMDLLRKSLEIPRVERF